MPWFDLSLDQLREYRTDTVEPPELDLSGRGMPAEHALPPALGYAVFVMDTRGQGSRRTTGATGVSQGGGLALAAAALVPQAVAVCHADVPSRPPTSSASSAT